MTGTILVVDDKADNRYLLEALFKGNGFEVTTARHGAEALTIARLHPPLLCITDLLMPVMDGYTLLRHWKSDPRLSAVPIMVYTATYTAPEDEQLALDMGADAFLVKPTEPEPLMTAARKLLEVPVKTATAPNLDDNPALLQQYSAALVRKLEEKSIALETSNQRLLDEAMARQALLSMRDAILEALPAQVALINQSGVIIATNRSWEEFMVKWQRSDEMRIGGNYLKACRKYQREYPGVANDLHAGILSVLAGKRQHFETEIIVFENVEPSKRWYRLIATPILYQERAGAVITRLDVTERRQMEEESRAAAARLSLAVDVAQIGIWEMQADGKLIWNHVMHDIYGVPHDVTPTVALWQSLVPPGERDRLNFSLARLSAIGGRDERRFSIVRTDGATRNILGVVKLLPSNNGTLGKLVGTNIDITARLQQELALQSINSRMETLVSEATIGILVQRDRKILLANEALARIVGLSSAADVMVLHNFDRFFPDDQRRPVRELWENLLADRPGAELLTLKGKRADGRPLEIELRAFCIDWDGGRATCSMITDVTDQRAIEAQLRQSQRLEAVGQLTGGVAHDFNNLLTVILGNAELLEEGLTADPMQHRLAGMIVRAAERGAELARHLLAFSRRQRLEPQVVDVNAMLVGLEDFLRRAVGATVSIDVVRTPDLWPALVDLAQLESALLNLAVNARDAMQDGGRVTIATRNVAAGKCLKERPADLGPGPHIVISLSDTGIGMDEETCLRAFEPFFTTKEVGKGSGLGLSMVYGFVKQSNGAVQIRSRPGQGTTVELWLPRAAAAGEPAQAAADTRSVPLGEEHLLVVEDDAMVRAQVIGQLEQLGYRVTGAGSGDEALELIRQGHHFDLLFTDIVMPGTLNGHGLVAAALELQPGLPVLLTSGFADRAERAAAVPDQAYPVLRKPYRRNELARKVREAIDRPLAQAVSG